ncbi:membrane-bound protein [Bacillus phage vB_BthM-Goe5]|nr:membrane-bound protein [Bacillus phage vB_BthM-Goe5]
MENTELEYKIKEIESILKEHSEDSEDIREVLEEIQVIVKDLDKSVALNEEKQSHLRYRIVLLNQRLAALETRGEKGTDKQRALVENALMVVLGGIISYIFSLSQK